MYVNKPRLRELMNTRAGGNYREFARQLKTTPPQLHRLLNTSVEASAGFLGKLMTYCKANGLDFNYYIFLEKTLHVSKTEADN